MKRSTKALICVGVLAALAAPASALTIPPMLPDICVYGHCIQFTRSTALAQVQSLYQQATQIANQVHNLKSIGNVARTAVDQEVGAITSLADPAHVGDAAAGHVLDQATGSAANVAEINARAASADGAQQQAQVGNLYLGTIATEAVKANAMAAEQQTQQKNTTTAEAKSLSDLLSGGIPTGEQP